jgi:two-component system cell cycle sensor histidine kinase/response regulator CckA
VARLGDRLSGPVNVRGALDRMAVLPVRDAQGRPDALLVVGIDAGDVATQAARTAWVVLAVGVGLLLVTTFAARRAIDLSVAERVRGVMRAVESSPDARRDDAALPGRDELQVLAAQVSASVARATARDARSRTLVDNAPLGIATADARCRLRSSNPAFRRLALGDADAALPTDLDATSLFADPADAARCHAVLAQGGRIDRANWRWRRPDGEEIEVRAAVVPLPPGDDEAAFELLVEDVSEQRALESQLQRAQRMELIGRLTGGIAHDFNNLLTVIRANVAALDDEARSAELGAIDDAAARGARLVRRLVSVSRRDTLALVPEPLERMLHDTVQLLRRVLPDNIVVESPAELPPLVLSVDRNALEQVLLNLALNARDAMPDGGTLAVTVTAREVRTREAQQLGLSLPGRFACLRVRDTGSGMPAGVLARAMEPFFTTKPPDQGSGLGLAVVEGIMRQHDGAVVLHSEPGAGTTVDLWFPAPTIATPPSSLPAAPRDAAERGEGERLLLVEDEEAVRRATERALRRLGYVVESVGEAHAALPLLAPGHAYALVVSDVMMPGMSGLDLLREVRATGEAVPFLFVSGWSTESLEGVLGRDAAVSVLPKPWTSTELARRVAAAIRTRRGSAVP